MTSTAAGSPLVQSGQSTEYREALDELLDDGLDELLDDELLDDEELDELLARHLQGHQHPTRASGKSSNPDPTITVRLHSAKSEGPVAPRSARDP